MFFWKEGKKLFIILMGVLSALIFVIPASASNTNGTIDGTSKYAWSSKAGWVDFGLTNGNIHITDSAVTGYAWNDLYGWILMNPANSGVVNDGEGTLSGYAWSKNLGWVNFSGTTISATGTFRGQASGDNYGVINFDCANCDVKTDWRPRSVRPACNNTFDDDGDGQTDYPADLNCQSLTDDNEGPDGALAVAPSGFSPAPSYFMVINNDDTHTVSRQVTMTLRCGTALYAWMSEDINFTSSEMVKVDCDSAPTYTYAPFVLSEGEGLKSVFAKFCNFWGQCSGIWADSIIYTLTPFIPIEVEGPVPPLVPTEVEGPEPIVVQPPSLVQTVQDYLTSLLTEIIPPQIKTPALPLAKLFKEKWLPKIKQLAPRFAKKPKLPPVEEVVSRKTPRSMLGPWQLLNPKPIQKFVFAPLPKEFLALVDKLPSIKNTFSKVGINRFSDLQKLKSVKINLPGLNQVLALKAAPAMGLAAMEPFKSVPMSELPANLKKEIPTNIVFTRGANELVDFNVALTLSDKGHAVQKITAISGKALKLAIKPDHPVKSVRGYVIYKSRTKESSSVLMPLATWFSSLVFAEPALAYPLEQPMEEKLVLQEFEYTDPDKDGIYTASIVAPVPEGEYEIITIMDYEDPDLGTRQVRLVTVIDPEGYVFEQIRDQELRVRGAVVSLYWLNKIEKRYELWPAGDYQQENPQVTDAKGSYSFLVPEGTYYLATEAPGYMPFEGKPFRVEQGTGVHYNIELKTRYWWLNMLDWRTILLVVIGLFLVYNFYKDRKRRAEDRS